MTASFLKLYASSIAICFAIDILWLGVFAKKFYDQQMGHLLRDDVQWIPAVLRAQTPEALAKIRDAVRRGVEAYARDGGFVVPMPAVLASATKD